MVDTTIAETYLPSILEQVHHNSTSLAKLVDDVWMTVQQNLVIGERVKLDIQFSKKIVTGTVIRSHRNDKKNTDASSSTNPSPSSSDKENDGHSKSVPLLPHLYDVQLDNEKRNISFIPASDLIRLETPPSKDSISHCIMKNSSAVCQSNKTLWSVNDELLQKYKIKNKIAPLFLSPKMGKRLENGGSQEKSRKRRLSSNSEQSEKKRVKLNGHLKTDVKEKVSKDSNKIHLMKDKTGVKSCYVSLNEKIKVKQEKVDDFMENDKERVKDRKSHDVDEEKCRSLGKNESKSRQCETELADGKNKRKRLTLNDKDKEKCGSESNRKSESNSGSIDVKTPKKSLSGESKKGSVKDKSDHKSDTRNLNKDKNEIESKNSESLSKRGSLCKRDSESQSANEKRKNSNELVKKQLFFEGKNDVATSPKSVLDLTDIDGSTDRTSTGRKGDNYAAKSGAINEGSGKKKMTQSKLKCVVDLTDGFNGEKKQTISEKQLDTCGGGRKKTKSGLKETKRTTNKGDTCVLDISDIECHSDNKGNNQVSADKVSDSSKQGLKKHGDKTGKTSASNRLSNTQKKSSETIVLDDSDSSEENVTLSSFKKLDDVPLIKLKKRTPKKMKSDVGLDSNTSESKVKPVSENAKSTTGSSTKTKITSKTSTSGLKTPDGKEPKRLNYSPEHLQNALQDIKDGMATRKAARLHGVPRTTLQMKQLTLFDLKQKPQKSVPVVRLSPLKSSPYTSAVIIKLQKALKTENRKRITHLIRQAALTLTPVQMARLPADVKQLVLDRSALIQERDRLNKMTDEERLEYKKQRKNEHKQKVAEIKKMTEPQKKMEDTLISGLPLPEPKLVPTPDGMPNEYFGDVAMVCEFIHCYAGLLLPKGQKSISADDLMESMVGPPEKFTAFAQVLVILLQTLLQDPIAKDYKEIGVELSKIPVSVYTAPELIRLCLRPHDKTADDSDSEDEDDDEVAESILESLENQDICDLDLEAKMAVLRSLFLRIMNTYSVQEYMTSTYETATKLKFDLQKRNAKDKQIQEDAKKTDSNTAVIETKEAEVTETNHDKNTDAANGLTSNHFYGAGGDVTPVDTPEMSGTEDAGADNSLVSKLKRRRELSALANKEKEEREKEKKLRLLQEFEAERKILEKKSQQIAAMTAHSTLRRTPLGVDRNHSRYWEFSALPSGLYVEKGWVGTFGYPTSIDSTGDHGNEDNTELFEGETFPHPSQNLWFIYSDPAELTEVMKSLHRHGIREGPLYRELLKNQDHIIMSLNKTKNMPIEIEQEPTFLESFKTELLDKEHRLVNGGLGGVVDLDQWESNVSKAADLSSLIPLVTEVEKAVIDKFRKGIMGVKERKKDDTEQDSTDEETTVSGITDWESCVENCVTFSRLHVLLGILDDSIKWTCSAEHAKCKICHKKKDDNDLLLCDECNTPYHLYCLRPAVQEIPPGDWLCPACIPANQRHRSRERRGVTRYGYERRESRSEEDSDDDPPTSESEEEKIIVHETECMLCGNGDSEGDIVQCIKCPCIYHLDCHIPPLRHAPRGEWQCNQCRTGVKFKRLTKKKRNLRTTRKPPSKRNTMSSSEEGETDEQTKEEKDSGNESSESEMETNGKGNLKGQRTRGNVADKPKKATRAGGRLTTKQRMLTSSESDEVEESATEHEEKRNNRGRQTNKVVMSKRTRAKNVGIGNSRQKKQDSDEEQESAEEYEKKEDWKKESVKRAMASKSSRGKKATNARSKKQDSDEEEESVEHEEKDDRRRETVKHAMTSKSSRGRKAANSRLKKQDSTENTEDSEDTDVGLEDNVGKRSRRVDPLIGVTNTKANTKSRKRPERTQQIIDSSTEDDEDFEENQNKDRRNSKADKRFSGSYVKKAIFEELTSDDSEEEELKTNTKGRKLKTVRKTARQTKKLAVEDSSTEEDEQDLDVEPNDKKRNVKSTKKSGKRESRSKKEELNAEEVGDDDKKSKRRGRLVDSKKSGKRGNSLINKTSSGDDFENEENVDKHTEKLNGKKLDYKKRVTKTKKLEEKLQNGGSRTRRSNNSNEMGKADKTNKRGISDISIFEEILSKLKKHADS